MQTGLILAIIVIQILAAAGAYLSAKLSDIFGNIRTLIGINILWGIICFYGYFVTTPTEFYIAAGFIGLGMGGIQSLSRSTYSKLIDVKYSTSYFSFYDVSQKLSIVLGTALYATMDVFTGSIRLAILIFAYLVRFLSVAFNPIESGLEKISEKIDYSALNAVSIVSDAVSNSENIVLVSISYERSRFIIEVQTNSYDQLQEYVDLVNSMGLNVNLGASRRVNNFIQGEISINAF